ncbi:hypothetical protein FHG64_12735 [Antarcticibacterium flavum]|uniref:MPN domain-containing protein n=1 Tax=Antarcticibacterium flavum TaxID=2058175 RepID=A0A5B7X4J9_9FLAO|nr:MULTISPECIES: Mov34/MPN/PAD-1 family protein [Antarcticibacterium]QCY70200.1 hypothetical protein FHG64_12735 [Antarcticibacterium flavum]
MVKERNGLRLIIPEALLSEMSQIGLEYYPNEFGGFLVGRYSDDLRILYITDFILPKKYIGLPSMFERSTDGLKEKLERLFVEKNQYYIGEWHTHPESSPQYSQTDLVAMKVIADHKKVNILNPVLLIISISKIKPIKHKFYIYKDNQLLAYE